MINSQDDSGPPLQRTQANTTSLLLPAGHSNAALLSVKWYISTMVCWHGTGTKRTDQRGVTHNWLPKGDPSYHQLATSEMLC